jgi:hypothetical protein
MTKVLSCSSCGGDLGPTDAYGYARCESCGRMQELTARELRQRGRGAPFDPSPAGPPDYRPPPPASPARPVRPDLPPPPVAATFDPSPAHPLGHRPRPPSSSPRPPRPDLPPPPVGNPGGRRASRFPPPPTPAAGSSGWAKTPWWPAPTSPLGARFAALRTRIAPIVARLTALDANDQVLVIVAVIIVVFVVVVALAAGGSMS